jgi:hypothetical protein
VLVLALVATVGARSAQAQVGVIDQYVPPGSHHRGAPPTSAGGGHHAEGHRGGGVAAGGGPSGGGPGGSGKARPATESGASLPSGNPPASERGGGSLPTGYPVTPLIWVVIAIVAAGGLAFAATAGRRRLRNTRGHAI